MHEDRVRLALGSVVEPADHPARQLVEMVASAAEWPLVAGNAPGSESYSYRRTWGVAAGLWLEYIEDLTTAVAVAVAFGEDGVQVVDLAGRLTGILRPCTRQELLTPVPADAPVPERIRAILRLALAAPPEFDGEIFSLLAAGFDDAEMQVRNAATWTTVYVDWPQLKDLLARVADSDPAEEMRRNARQLLRLV
jgi:hypothetical protein